MTAAPSSPDGDAPPVDSARRQPARRVAFRIDTRLSRTYRTARAILRIFLRVWFRPRVFGRTHVPSDGPVVLAPVHRSYIDFLFALTATDRKLFFMAKDDLWRSRTLGWILVTLGVFPVHRESADREALRRAQEVLAQRQVLVLFPEGTRQSGPTIDELQEGAAFLATRTEATIVPMGIGGSDRAMPRGRVAPRPVRITVVFGPPIVPSVGSGSGRITRSEVHRTSARLRHGLQQAYDAAQAEGGPPAPVPRSS